MTDLSTANQSRRRFLQTAALVGAGSVLGYESSFEATAQTDQNTLSLPVWPLVREKAAKPTLTADGSLVAYADRSAVETVVKRVADGERVATLDRGDCPAFSPDGEYLVTVRDDPSGESRGLVAYDTETWDVVYEDQTTTWAARGTAFSPGGEYVVYGLGNGEVRIFDTESWDLVTTVSGGDWRSYDTVFSKNYFAHTNDDGVYVYEYPGFEQREHFADAARATGIALSGDGSYLAYPLTEGSDPTQVAIRRTSDWSKVTEVSVPDSTVLDLAFFGSGGTERLAAVGGEAETVYLIDTDDWEVVGTHSVAGAELTAESLATGSTAESVTVAWQKLSDTPTVEIGVNSQPVVGTPAEFTVETDAGQPASVSWEFGEGDERTTENGTIEYTFEESGLHTVTAMVGVQESTIPVPVHEGSADESTDDSDSTPEGNTTESGTASDGFGPGFGLGSSLAGLGGFGYLLKRRLEDTEQ
jgi:WD40 repeat protein